MANEGSTKPTYSELEIHIRELEVACAIAAEQSEATYLELARVRGLLLEVAEGLNLPAETLDIASCNHIAHVAKQARENAALYFQKWAEVRGLLQRHLLDCHSGDQVSDYPHLSDEQSTMQLIKWLAGAESADIGKLDTADKKKVSEMCLDCMDWHGKGDCKLGSAETGGEKAAPPPQHPFELTILIGGENWDYVVRTANKVAEHLSEHGEDCSLVSGGGGGCHSVEIVKRDISAEDYEKELLDWHENLPASEPEKLNNAQKVCAKCGEILEHWQHSPEEANPHHFEPAESSLSSPPPGNPQLVIACLEEAIELFELDDDVNTPGTDSWLWKVKSEQALIAYAEAESSPNFRESPELTEHGAESVPSGKQNTADKLELLPTQLPKEK